MHFEIYLSAIKKMKYLKKLKRAFVRIMGISHNTNFIPYIKTKHIEGTTFDFWIGDKDGADWYDHSCTDPFWPEMRFIKDRMIQHSDVVLECGGHHGCTALLLSSWVGEDGKIITIEPSEPNCLIINKNLELNSTRNIRVERKAVGAKPGRVKISCASNAAVSLHGEGVNVPLIDIDSYHEENPTLLKIDVEGFEVEVLKGASKTILKRPMIAIEIHPEELNKYGSSVLEIFELLKPGHYRYWIQWNDEDMPVPYSVSDEITSRVHLFCIPDESNTVSSPIK